VGNERLGLEVVVKALVELLKEIPYEGKDEDKDEKAPQAHLLFLQREG